MDTSDDYTRSSLSFGAGAGYSSSLAGPSSATGNTTLFSGLGKDSSSLGDPSRFGDADDGLDESEPLLQKLTRYWVDERNSPEILEWQGLVVDEVLNRLHAQVRVLFLPVPSPPLGHVASSRSFCDVQTGLSAPYGSAMI